jgi:protein-S-isoprenylcysteine O-methyltransferase Ste14
MPIDFAARPNDWPWPPLLFAIALVAALALAAVAPLPLELPAPVRAIGAIVALAGFALWLWGAVTMRRARVNMAPTRAAGALLESGPFAVSRHPLYVGGAIGFFGLGVALSHAWICLAALVAAGAIERFGVAREEAHLAARFGERWTRYASRTPRWLGPGSLRAARR